MGTSTNPARSQQQRHVFCMNAMRFDYDLICEPHVLRALQFCSWQRCGARIAKQYHETLPICIYAAVSVHSCVVKRLTLSEPVQISIQPTVMAADPQVDATQLPASATNDKVQMDQCARELTAYRSHVLWASSYARQCEEQLRTVDPTAEIRHLINRKVGKIRELRHRLLRGTRICTGRECRSEDCGRAAPAGKCYALTKIRHMLFPWLLGIVNRSLSYRIHATRCAAGTCAAV
jgi:hypothetical protein